MQAPIAPFQACPAYKLACKLQEAIHQWIRPRHGFGGWKS